LARGALRAQPDWYALLLTRSLVGYRPLPTTVTGAGEPNLLVASFSGPRRSVQVVLVDDEPPGTRPLALTLHVGAGLGPGRILRLTGPAPSATGDILLGGHAVAPNGTLHAPIRPERVAAHAGALTVELAPSSAALVTVSPRPHGTVRHRTATRLSPASRGEP
jgi:hypothetical protein